MPFSAVLGQIKAQTSPEKDFEQFSDSLVSALQESDTAFIFNRVDSEVMNGLADQVGKARFRELWYDAYTPLRRELLIALSLGGAYLPEYGNKVFVPHQWITFPDSLDAFQYVYPLADSVKMYENPDPAESVTSTLKQKWIEVFHWPEWEESGQQDHTEWIGVVAINQDSGYVMADQVRSPLDYRFWFEKKDNKWTLMGWAAGD